MTLNRKQHVNPYFQGQMNMNTRAKPHPTYNIAPISYESCLNLWYQIKHDHLKKATSAYTKELMWCNIKSHVKNKSMLSCEQIPWSSS